MPTQNILLPEKNKRYFASCEEIRKCRIQGVGDERDERKEPGSKNS